jgi:hypothetical protein
VLEVDVVAAPDRAALDRFAFRPTYVRLPGYVIVPVDSARSPMDGAAWAVARRVLGTALLPWPSSNGE